MLSVTNRKMHTQIFFEMKRLMLTLRKLEGFLAKRRVQGMIEGSDSSTTDLAFSICEFMLEIVSSAGVKTKENVSR